MTDDTLPTVEDARASLTELVQCRCHEAYTGRGLRDPDCECDYQEEVQTVFAALDAAHAELDALRIALELYADQDGNGYDVNVIDFGPDFGTSLETGAIIKDAGERARAALKGPRHD